MAIGNSGGSAASRFRPRGTAPLAGLGRRNLLAEEGTTEAEDSTQENEVSTQAAPAPSPRGFNRPAPNVSVERLQSTAVAGEPLLSALAEESSENSAPETAVASVTLSTSTDPSPSTEATSSPRRRGRPSASTRSDATAGSQPDTDGTALSAAGARARMREIEAELKSRRAHLQTEINAMQKAFELQSAVLRSEYKALVDIVLEG